MAFPGHTHLILEKSANVFIKVLSFRKLMWLKNQLIIGRRSTAEVKLIAIFICVSMFENKQDFVVLTFFGEQL